MSARANFKAKGYPHAIGTLSMAGMVGRAALWSALAFVLNLTWEIAQVRLYTIWATSDGTDIAKALLHCSVGDVVIALAMYALAGIVVRRADWPAARPWTGGAIVVVGSMAFTAWSEWNNVYNVGAWSYAESMPMLFGIGLSPLLQWLILPAALVGAYRKLEPLLFGSGTSQTRRAMTEAP